jgi:nitrite reductase/ring-hydroxylating ferredoxin subunit
MTDGHGDPLSDEAKCGGHCALSDALNAPEAMERRAFLRAGAMALASLGMLGLGARAMDAMTVDALGALSARRGDRRAEKRYPVPTTDSVSVDREHGVIIARAAGKIYAFALSCPHQNTALRWSPEDKEYQCSKHHSHYRADGSFIDGRATRDMDRLAVRRDGQMLVVEVDTLYQQDLNLAQWTAAFIPV